MFSVSQEWHASLHHVASPLARVTDREKTRRARRDLCALVDGGGARSPISAAGHAGAEGRVAGRAPPTRP